MPGGFLKGQLHAHTSNSADSNTPAREAHRWYEEHGYDFVVFTDHNVVTDTEDTGMLTIPGVELTQNLRTCDPPAGPGKICALHMNVLFATNDAAGLGPAQTISRHDVYRQELERARTMGGIAMLNHPNLMYGTDAALISTLSRDGLTLLEVGNQAWDSENGGDAAHPSCEAIWDGALTSGARVFATATDDAHHYGDAAAMRARGERPFDGDHGFVVVRADRNVPKIRAAVARGDFYSSTGVLFESYELGAETMSLAVRGTAPVLFEVIGQGGKVVRRERGVRLEVRLERDVGPYLRVRVTRDDGAIAWTQPLFR